jgi:hypothetical protein
MSWPTHAQGPTAKGARRDISLSTGMHYPKFRSGMSEPDMTSDNDRQLDRIMYRKAFDDRADHEGEAKLAAELAEKDKARSIAIDLWVQMEPLFHQVIDRLNEKLSVVGLALDRSSGVAHDYAPSFDPALAKFRLDLRENGAHLAKNLECTLTTSGTMLFYFFYPTRTGKLHVPLSEVTTDRFETILLDFIEGAIQ